MTDQIVLVTGASTGIGRVLAEMLPGAGHTPVATMRDAGGRNAGHAAALRDKGVAVVELDVEVDSSVESGVQQTIAELGRIDVVVNNAGYGIYGPLEAATVDDMRRQFETNVYGVQRVNRAVLPHMRERRSGLLVGISSGAGRLGYPGAGLYCMSKWALEAMSESLRWELAPLGIDSVLVEPGPHATDFHTRSLLRVTDGERTAPYEHLQRAAAHRSQSMKLADAADVARAIIDLIDTPRGKRPLRVVAHGSLGAELGAINASSAAAHESMLREFGTPELLENGV